MVVHEHHDEVGARGGEPAAELVEAGVEPVALLGFRHLGPSGDQRGVRREESRDDLSHGALPVRPLHHQGWDIVKMRPAGGPRSKLELLYGSMLAGPSR